MREAEDCLFTSGLSLLFLSLLSHFLVKCSHTNARPYCKYTSIVLSKERCHWCRTILSHSGSVSSAWLRHLTLSVILVAHLKRITSTLQTKNRLPSVAVYATYYPKYVLHSFFFLLSWIVRWSALCPVDRKSLLALISFVENILEFFQFFDIMTVSTSFMLNF